MPNQQLDQAQVAQHDAETSLQQAREQEAAAARAVDTDAAAAATVRARKAALAIARRGLENTTVRAFHAGRVVSLTVSSGEMVAPSQTLFTLVNTEEWFAVANFRETDLSAIAIGDCVTVYSMIDRQKPLKGVVQGIGVWRARHGARQPSAFAALCRAFTELGKGRATLSGADPARESARAAHEAGCQCRRAGEAWPGMQVTFAVSLRQCCGCCGRFPEEPNLLARLALICALTTLVVQIYQTPEPALTAYVAFFVIKPDRTTSMVISLVMMLLITLIIGIVILVSMAVVDQPLWRVTSMAMISFGLLFLASASKLKPVGAIMALIIAYALDLLSQAQIGELATRGFLYAWLFVTIPAAVSLVVNLFLGPPPRRLAERALAHRLTLAAAMLRSPDHDTRHLFAEALVEGTAEIKTWLKLAGAEKTSPPEDIDALRQAADSITPTPSADRYAGCEMPRSILPPVLKERMARTSEEMAEILNAGGYPVDITIDDEEIDLGPSEAAFVAEMKEAFARFTQAPLPDLPPPQTATAKSGFFLPDAFTNPQHVHYALKTTAAAMFCYVVYSLLDWPGIHT